jgi:putative FmdB family regulatory protein
VPTYQYACTSCGHQLEAVQSFADEPLTECPTCEGRLRKIFSSVGVVFKGSGFYRTDSRSTPAESSGKEPDTNGSAAKDAKGAKKESGDSATGSPSSSSSASTSSNSSSSSGSTSASSSSAKTATPA